MNGITEDHLELDNKKLPVNTNDASTLEEIEDLTVRMGNMSMHAPQSKE
jgi:hypothetical protein